MAIQIVVDPSELLKFIGKLDRTPQELERMLRDTVNEVGDEMYDELVRVLIQETGFTPSAAGKFITVSRATLGDQTYEMTIKQGVMEDELTRRGPTRDFQKRAEGVFNQDMLVNVITAQDGAVCPICERISEEGPYTIEETRHLRDVHPHFLNRDLNCRCALTPFKPQGRESISQKTGDVKGVQFNPHALRTLADRVAARVGIAFNIIKA